MAQYKIAVLTSGGDAPGMNAAIYGLTAQAISANCQVYIVKNGYEGLIDNLIEPINYHQVKQHVHTSGSFIGSSRSSRFQNDQQLRQQAVNNLKQHGIEALVVIGGNGSYQGAETIANLGFPVITIPGTVDNDVNSSLVTIGFDSSAQEILNCLKNLRQTGESHQAIFLIEAMGRDCVDLSVFAGITGLVDAIVTNENIFSLDDFLAVINQTQLNQQRSVLFLITEKIYGPKFKLQLDDLSTLAQKIEAQTNRTTRVMVLGHLQRGAVPTFNEIKLAIGFGRKAVDLIVNNQFNLAIGSNGWEYYTTELKTANQMTTVKRHELIAWNNSLTTIKNDCCHCHFSNQKK